MTKLLKDSSNTGLYCFQCPGCGHLHQIADKTYQGPGAKWEFNGDLNKPTFSPSYLLWCDDPETKQRLRTCHSFIKDGHIQFLNDCTHHLAGVTVELPTV